MKTAALSFIATTALLGSTMAIAADDAGADRSHPLTFVKDSALTTKVKAKLAAEHVTSVGRIHVDTDKDGVVWLSGTARTQAAIDQAVRIARETDGVVSVHSDLTVRKDD